jgi:hypothetical protein
MNANREFGGVILFLDSLPVMCVNDVLYEVVKVAWYGVVLLFCKLFN